MSYRYPIPLIGWDIYGISMGHLWDIYGISVSSSRKDGKKKPVDKLTKKDRMPIVGS